MVAVLRKTRRSRRQSHPFHSSLFHVEVPCRICSSAACGVDPLAKNRTSSLIASICSSGVQPDSLKVPLLTWLRSQLTNGTDSLFIWILPVRVLSLLQRSQVCIVQRTSSERFMFRHPGACSRLLCRLFFRLLLAEVSLSLRPLCSPFTFLLRLDRQLPIKW